MSYIDKKLQTSLKALSSFCYDKSNLVIFSILLTFCIFTYSISFLKMDMSTASTLNENDITRIEYENFKNQFGRDDVVIIAIPIQSKLNNEFINEIHNLHTDIEKLEHIAEVTSLINVKHVYGENDELIIEDMFEEWPNHSWNMTNLYQLLTTDPSFYGRIISKDGKYTSILIKLESLHNGIVLKESDISLTLTKIKSLVSKYERLKPSISGTTIIVDELNRLTSEDALRSTSFSLLGLFIILLFFFKRFTGIILPLLIVSLSVLAGLSMMAVNNRPFTVTSNTLMPIILAVGIADAIHILVYFFHYYDNNLFDKKEAIVNAVLHSAPAVTFTSLTTAAGFLSFTNSHLMTFVDLGIYSAISVMFALFFTIIILPAFIAKIPLKRSIKTAKNYKQMETFLSLLNKFVISHPKSISVIGILLIIITGIFGASNIKFSNDILSYFPDELKVKQDLFIVDRAFEGVNSFEIIIDTNTINGAYNLNFLQDLEVLINDIRSNNIAGIKVSDTFSILDIAYQTNQALNNNSIQHYKLASDQELLSQELLLFEMGDSETLNKVTDSNHQIARVTLKTKYRDSTEYRDFIEQLTNKFNDTFPNTTVTVTSVSTMAAKSIPLALSDMIQGSLLSLIVISILMGVATNSIKLGLVSMIPNLLPITAVLTTMKIFDWSFDLTTAMVAAIALGIIVDDTLHFIYNFKTNYEIHKNAVKAVEVTMNNIGKAIILTTLIIVTIFGINITSSLQNVVMFSILLSLISLFALISDLLLTPALLIVLYGKHKN